MLRRGIFHAGCASCAAPGKSAIRFTLLVVKVEDKKEAAATK